MIVSFGLLCYTCVQESNNLVLHAQHNELVLNNGVLMYKGRPFNGMLLDHYSNGAKRMEVMYHDGRKHGNEIQWYDNGTVATTRNYLNGKKSGLHQGYWENGNYKFVYHFNSHGAYHGNIKEWYSSGALMRDFNYLNGKENGTQKMWMQNGKIRANYEVVNGERFGLIGLKKCYQVSSNTNIKEL